MSNKHYIIPFFIPHIGCPHDCVFCSQNKITGREDSISAGEILPTVREYLATLPNDNRWVEVAFFGGSFTGIPAHHQEEFLEKARYAKEKGLIDGIRLSTRPDYIDETVLKRLKSYLVDTIELGVQSMDDRVLKKSLRGHTAADVLYASNLIKENGFCLGLQMMIGLPGSSPNIEIETARRICEIGPKLIRIYPALVIRGTALETMYLKGKYKPLSLEDAVETCTVLAEMFIKSDINVIRMGLQPTDLINAGREVVAGPFHPAFRQLVDSKLLRKTVKRVLDQRSLDDEAGLVIQVNPALVSTLQGIKKESLSILKKEYPELRITVSQNNTLGKWNVRFINGATVFEVDYRRVIIKD